MVPKGSPLLQRCPDLPSPYHFGGLIANSSSSLWACWCPSNVRLFCLTRICFCCLPAKNSCWYTNAIEEIYFFLLGACFGQPHSADHGLWQIIIMVFKSSMSLCNGILLPLLSRLYPWSSISPTLLNLGWLSGLFWLTAYGQYDVVWVHESRP